jgi:hypothetical protein
LKISGTFNSETIASKRALAITATFWSAAVIVAVGLAIQSVREIFLPHYVPASYTLGI